MQLIAVVGASAALFCFATGHPASSSRQVGGRRAPDSELRDREKLRLRASGVGASTAERRCLCNLVASWIDSGRDANRTDIPGSSSLAIFVTLHTLMRTRQLPTFATRSLGRCNDDMRQLRDLDAWPWRPWPLCELPAPGSLVGIPPSREPRAARGGRVRRVTFGK